ncbi:MAG: VacB/RNase II family 3'-5' exoribonuclease [Oscillospiraceae bacterium]|nr:VacB/RNase II family 3'-5' exoribonuclease [Oscillospiraceae bacterium]
MSKKPKKVKSQIKSKNKNIKKGGNRTKSVAAFKGVILRVARTHGFIKDESAEQEYFISGRDLLGAVPGDIVLCERLAKSARLPKTKEETCLPEARVTRILKASESLLVGTVIAKEEGVLCLIPDSFGSRFPLELGSWGGNKLKAGDKVSFTLKSRGARHHLHIAEITSVYGSSQRAQVCVDAYLEEKRVVREFSEEAEDEAESCGEIIDAKEVPNRLDLRELPIFTIDGADTKDIDDAISIEKADNGYRLGVHIADVSYYVTPESQLNTEAFERGTSVYIADLVVPMLPKALSNGICSLNPGVDRFAFSCLMEIAKSGELKSFEFKKTVIRSRVQGVYGEINTILEGGKEFDFKYKEVSEQFPIMLELATTLKKNREGRNAPALNSPECKIICGEDGSVADIKRRESGENAVSEGIIEEFMLLANNAAARLAMEKDLPFVYRVHEAPAAEKLTRLSETLQGLGLAVPELKPTAESLSKVLQTAKETAGSEKFDVVNMAVLRAMMKAKYSHEPLGHFGLVMSEYAHFTSPIRRYPDLSIHRILSDYITDSKQERLKKRYGKFACESALKSTNTELRAVNAERDCNKFYFAEYMSSHIDEEFEGSISGVTDMSIYVMLENTVEGRVSFRSDVSGEHFSGYQSDGVRISNSVTGVQYTLGDKVTVKCVGCNVPMGLVDFEIV